MMNDQPNILYLDCSSGISGDMTVAALLDLGADEKGLRDMLKTLPLDGYRIEVSRVKKAGIDACDFNVVLDDAHENHDHDMEYLHGFAHEHEHHREYHHEHEQHGHEHDHHEHDHEHGHDHEHEHHHDHEHTEPLESHSENHLYEAAHDHDDHEHSHDHEHHHEHEHHHDHKHQDQEHHHGHHHGRNMDDITQILYSGSLTDRALSIALRIFEVVAEAESKAHGLPIDQVHFHEVGAVDSIVDIASIAYCVDDLHIDEVIIPSLTEGTGLVRCQHGLLPIPVPATSAIVSTYGIPMRILPIEGELVTPTGAATVATLRTSSTLPASFTIRKMGLGAGKRDYAVAGILRAMLIEPVGSETVPGAASENKSASRTVSAQDAVSGPDTNDDFSSGTEEDRNYVLKMETNVDDCSGEALGFVMEQLFEAGARDVFYTPIYMKKNRPAVLLSIICDPGLKEKMEEILFRHTTTIGVRYQKMQRTKLLREDREFETPLGNCRVKFCSFRGEVYCYPEHESVAEIAKRSGLGYSEVYNILKTYAVTHADAE